MSEAFSDRRSPAILSSLHLVDTVLQDCRGSAATCQSSTLTICKVLGNAEWERPLEAVPSDVPRPPPFPVRGGALQICNSDLPVARHQATPSFDSGSNTPRLRSPSHSEMRDNFLPLQHISNFHFEKPNAPSSSPMRYFCHSRETPPLINLMPPTPPSGSLKFLITG